MKKYFNHLDKGRGKNKEKLMREELKKKRKKEKNYKKHNKKSD